MAQMLLLPSARRGLPSPWAALARWTRGLTTSGRSSDVPKPVPLSKLKDSFNDATSVSYLEELEKRFQSNPDSIDRTWASFFTNLGANRGSRMHARLHGGHPGRQDVRP